MRLKIPISSTATQTLTRIRDDTILWAYLRFPSHIAFRGGRAATYGLIVRAYDTDVADWMWDIRLRTSFLVLALLANLGVRTSWQTTGLCSAHRTGSAFQTWGTTKLTFSQSRCCVSFLILTFLANIRIRTSRKITERGGTYRTVPTVRSRGTSELTCSQTRCTPILILIVLADLGIRTSRQVTERSGAYRTVPAMQTWRTTKLAFSQIHCCTSLLGESLARRDVSIH